MSDPTPTSAPSDEVERLFIDQDGDACLEPSGRKNNLVALPARDDDYNILNPEAWQAMVDAFNSIADLREKLEAAEAALRRTEANRDAILEDLNDARAQIAAGEAAGFIAGRDAVIEEASPWLHHEGAMIAQALTPPASPLQRLLDAEWNAAIEAAASVCEERRQAWLVPYIRALRRVPA